MERIPWKKRKTLSFFYCPAFSSQPFFNSISHFTFTSPLLSEFASFRQIMEISSIQPFCCEEVKIVVQAWNLEIFVLLEKRRAIETLKFLQTFFLCKQNIRNRNIRKIFFLERKNLSSDSSKRRRDQRSSSLRLNRISDENNGNLKGIENKNVCFFVSDYWCTAGPPGFVHEEVSTNDK